MSRLIAIGDIHGCLKTLNSALDSIGPAKDDTVILLGDYVDRGPNSKGVIDLLIKARQDGYDFRPLMGNHEDILLRAIDGVPGWDYMFTRNGGTATLDSYGKQLPSAEHIAFIRTLPYIHVSPDFVFAHAALDFGQENPLLNPEQHEYCYEGEMVSTVLWKRNYTTVPGKIGNRTLVTGHTITPESDIQHSLSSKHIRLDNGCFLGNSLAVLFADERRIQLFPNLDI